MPPGSLIREAKPADLDRMHQLENLCFEGPIAYSRSQLAYLAFRANSTCLVNEKDGEFMGFIIALYRQNSKTAGIETVDVHPGHRRKGVGRTLLSATEDDMRKNGARYSRLEVAELNRDAINLYRQAGYEVMYRMDDYYTHPHHGTKAALRMIKEL